MSLILKPESLLRSTLTEQLKGSPYKFLSQTLILNPLPNQIDINGRSKAIGPIAG